MPGARQQVELRGAVHLDKMQPQFAATCAANSDGYFPVAGESAFWLEVCPGIVVNRLLDVALKSCDVTPGALITERSHANATGPGPDVSPPQDPHGLPPVPTTDGWLRASG